MKRPPPELIPLLIAAFLVPIIGGHVSLDSLALEGSYFSAILGGPEAPFGTRALLGTLIAASLAIALIRKSVVQIPSLPISVLSCAVVVLTGFSIFSSSFTYVSYSSWLTWAVYALAGFSVVAVIGRKSGSRALMWAMVAGGTICAFKGIREYADMRAIDPSHRVFAGWNNPNATAGILCILVPLAIGLLMSSEGLESLGAGLCAGLMIFTLALTQSKGGLLCLGVSLIVVLATAIAWKAKARVVRAGIAVGLGALLVIGASTANRGPSQAPFERVVNSASSQEQSAGFRTLLWKSSVEMIQTKPTGYGVGTFRFESARPGLTEQTFHAHQTWLQLAVEASPLAALALVALAVSWVATLLTGARKWPWPEAGLRCGVLGSCAAAAANGFVESNLVYLGTGMVTFMVIGIGLQLSSDGVLPEFTPKKIRWALAALFCVLPVGLLWHTAMVENAKASALQLARAGDRSGAMTSLAMAQTLAPIDGETNYLLSGLSSDQAERAKLLGRASSQNPSTKYLRAFARVAAELDWATDVERSLERALVRDPNNLQALEQLYKWYESVGRNDDALKTAERLVGIEKTTVFQIRAIPEIVPLETYDARVFLAAKETQHTPQIEYLRPALEGYVAYALKTAPLVKRMTAASPNGSFLGHDREEISHVKEMGRKVVERLRDLYSGSGDSASLSWLEEASKALEEA